MIRTLSSNQQGQITTNESVEELVSGNSSSWYWIDFNSPTDEEARMLSTPLKFHPLAIEDCLLKFQRPKLDYYDGYTFFVMHAVNPETLEKEEVNIFLGENYLVTFHNNPSREINEIWNRVISGTKDDWSPSSILYHVLDQLVDNYFPPLYAIEDQLDEMDESYTGGSTEELLKKVFEIRQSLLLLRHTVTPTRDLIYRMMNSQRLSQLKIRQAYFSDIHDHLLKLTDMIDSNRELTKDIRDSVLSINSYETNRVMKVLTVITVIFMPLTFIAGIYGMNFDQMPELHWKNGYFISLAAMGGIALAMFALFWRKGWFK
ncbi:magnesium and cobalt transport protein CorA [Neobacillus notoginsengisoli]|uniref:Magnesium transport protein CorA n=1 Tax=Neobacillus notoginsengisoli TaxID=1578198 RepID=A0A417YRZ7_9BACI|nr:magnesium/cobalt transporter CorA [Neobacillus notoginsengisoli]RHW38066.1 magnesium and cobalt transport protein CorA [Neobacillus notoginsengisoli]